MIFIIGLIGFILGFFAGQLLLVRLLRHYSREELMENKKLRKYAILNWIIALACSWLSIWMYNYYL